jgi:competence CoiA-like predicted nuclease
MSVIESAFYHGELWCTYDLKDINGSYYEEYRLKMRKESQMNQFICPDCGEHLILCAGPIMEPYFKHHENTQCLIREVHGGTRYLSGRRLLYTLVKRSFPEAKIYLNYKLEDEYRAGIYVEHGVHKLCIEYLSHDMKLAEWEEKHDYYKKNGILDIWILDNKKYKKEHLQTFEYLIATNASPVIKILNSLENVIILKQNVWISKAESNKLLYCEYPIKDLIITPSGEFDCEFIEDCNMEMEHINNMILQEQLEQLEKEEEERLEQLAWENRRKELKEEREMEAYYEALYSSNVKTFSNKVIREVLNNETEINSNKMKMIHIKEAWQLPVIDGKENLVKRARGIRYSYLKELDKMLGRLSEDEKEIRIQEAIHLLELKKEARQWV